MQNLYVECLNRNSKTIVAKVFMLKVVSFLVMNTIKEKSAMGLSCDDLLVEAKEVLNTPVVGMTTYGNRYDYLTKPLMTDLNNRLERAIKQANPSAQQHAWMGGIDRFMLVMKELTIGLVDSLSLIKDEVVDTADALVKQHNIEIKVVELGRTWIFEAKSFSGFDEIVMGDWFVNGTKKPKLDVSGEGVWLFSLFKEIAFFMTTQKEVGEVSKLMDLK